MKKAFLFLSFIFGTTHCFAQVVINTKGTKVVIDSSKWKSTGADIYFKNTGKVGIGTTAPSTQLHTTSGVRFQGLGTNITDTKIVTTDALGNLNTRLLSSLPNNVDSTTATNGLNLLGKNVQLGGNLTQATTINNNANVFTIATGGAALNITGLTTGASTDSLVTINTTTGKINRVNLSALNKKDSTTASNGLTLVGKDVRLGGNLTEPTTINSNNNFLTFETGGTPLIINGLPNGLSTDQFVVQDIASGQLKTIGAADIQTKIAETADLVGTQVLTNTFANINLATTVISDPGYTVTPTTITIVNAGTYRITYRVSANVTNNVNAGGEFRLVAGGTTVIPGTSGFTYHNNANTSQGTTTVVVVLPIPANTPLSLQGRTYSTTGTLRLTANGSSFLVEKIR